MALRKSRGIRPGLLAVGLAAVLLAPVAADTPIDGLLDKAKSDYAASKTLQALVDVRAAFDRLWDEGPLFLTQAVLVKEDPQGYGHYDPRDSIVYSQNDPLFVYLEPAGYGFQHDGALYRFGFAVDIEILDATGKRRGYAKDFTNFDYVKRTANKEIELNFSVGPFKLPPGDYRLKLTVHDKVKNQAVEHALPFTLK